MKRILKTPCKTHVKQLSMEDLSNKELSDLAKKRFAAEGSTPSLKPQVGFESSFSSILSSPGWIVGIIGVILFVVAMFVITRESGGGARLYVPGNNCSVMTCTGARGEKGDQGSVGPPGVMGMSGPSGPPVCNTRSFDLKLSPNKLLSRALLYVNYISLLCTIQLTCLSFAGSSRSGWRERLTRTVFSTSFLCNWTSRSAGKSCCYIIYSETNHSCYLQGLSVSIF